MEKFLQNLKEAEAITHTCDHLIYMTYPLVRDKKLLLKILSELKKAIVLSMNSILQYEYMLKRISLYSDSKTNMRIFCEKCAKKYSLNEEDITKINEIIRIADEHKKSPLEFSKNGNVIILSENMEKTLLNIDKMKTFLELSKKILKNTKSSFLRKI